MKTSHKIIFALKKCDYKCDIGHIQRLVPGLTKKQISCSLTKLVSKGFVKFETPNYTRHGAGNNKPNRVYWV